MKEEHKFTVSEYLLARLKGLGVDHLFGIPGDFILPFFRYMEASDVTHVAACNELNAGYAADGYARVKGLAAVAATYGPGAFSLVNAAAGALAERVPIVFISGGPERASYQSRPMLHHVLPDKYDASVKIFEQVTVYAKVLDNPDRATEEIDQALCICLTEMKPVYLEIPRDVQTAACARPAPMTIGARVSDSAALQAAVEAVGDRIEHGTRSVILPGHEIHRFGLQDKVMRLAREKALDVGSLFIGKPDYIEHLPECIGLYQGAGSLPEVKQYVEGSDNVIFLGAVPSDFNLGGFTDDLTDTQTICVLENQVRTVEEVFDKIYIEHFIDALLDHLPEKLNRSGERPVQAFMYKADHPYNARSQEPMTDRRFYDRMAHFIRGGDVICADAGCALNSSHLQSPANVTHVASCYWASIGMGFAAAFGTCFATGDNQRIIAVEGDGSFQMTAQELSSMTRYGKTAIVFVINNKGYTAERLIHDGAFNDIADWKYHKLPEAFGGKGLDVHTEEGLEEALALADTWHGPGPLVIEVHLDPWDASEAFTLMSENLRGQ